MWQDEMAPLRVPAKVLEQSAPFFFFCSTPCEGANQRAESAFFPASNIPAIP